MSGPPDLLNRCAEPPCDRPGATARRTRAERALQPLTGVHGAWVAELPELAFLRRASWHGRHGRGVRAGAQPRPHQRRVHVRRRRLGSNRATIRSPSARGYLGSYPNFIFDVDVTQIETFTQTLGSGQDAIPTSKPSSTRWGVRRTSPQLWPTVDWVHDDFRRRQPTEFGLFDLDRYDNL